MGPTGIFPMGQTQGTGDKVLPRSVDVPGEIPQKTNVVFWGSKKQGPWLGVEKNQQNNEENGWFDEFKWSD